MKLAENVNTSQFFKKSYSPNRQTLTHVADAQMAQEMPRVWTPERAAAPAQTKFGAFEWTMVVMTFVVCIGLIGANLWLQSRSQSIQRSIEEMQAQTVELRNQTDLMRSHLMEQYNYDAIKQAAEKQGMQVRPGSVKDLTR